MTLPRMALASAGALALVAVTATPAHAATFVWDGPPTGANQETSVAENWAADVLPSPGDIWVFSAGTRANNSLPTDTLVGALQLDSPGFFLTGTRIQLDTAGVTATANAELNIDITLSGSQTWAVADGATLSVSGTVLVPSGELTLSPTGTVAFTTGRLDGVGGAGTVRQTSGTVVLAGSGGEIGGGGYLIAGGTSHWQGVLGGTAVQLAGESGVLSGIGAAQRINASAGTVSPGPEAGGAGTGELESWDTITLTPATRLQLDITDTAADTLLAYQSIDLGGALLELRVPDGIDPLARTTIATSTLGAVSGGLATAEGPIVVGEPFVSGGHRWTLEADEINDPTLELVWIERVVVDEGPGDGDGGGDGGTTPPVSDGDGDSAAPQPVSPAAPELPATGVSAPTTALGVLAAALIAAGAWLLRRQPVLEADRVRR